MSTALGAILRTPNGSTYYPIGEGQHVLVTPVDTAHIVTVANPERLEVVGVGNGPHDLSPARLVQDLAAIGKAMADMRARR